MKVGNKRLLEIKHNRTRNILLENLDRGIAVKKISSEL